MAHVTLRRYHESGATGDRQLVETRLVETVSTKPVTARPCGWRWFRLFH